MLSQLHELLQDHPWQENLQYFDTIDSTNTYAKNLAIQGAASGTIVMADQQTGGRGRLGRSFSSPAGLGIYLSLILRPNCLPEALMHLTCATAVAASAAVEAACGKKPLVKWTNDLILGRRKLGGILTELSIDPKSGLVDWVVIGIGINCCQRSEDFPPEIRDIACSLELGRAQRPKVAAELIKELYTMQQDLLLKKTQIMAAYRKLCITIGQDISLLRGDTVRHGHALDMDDDGALIVRFADGSIETVASGEVSIRGMYGYL